MKTFYDYRGNDFKNPKKHPLQGRVILKSKKIWLCKIYKDKHLSDANRGIDGFIVAPRTIYLYDVYIAKSFWDALKYFIKHFR